MKAAVWYARGDVRAEEVSDPPAPPHGQVQVKVAHCGICGTDLHEYLAGPLYIPVDRPHRLTGVQAPVIIGHEMSGEVIGIGEGVRHFAVGDRVAACPIIGCGQCRWCQSGSMAQCDQVAFLGTSWTGGALAERVNLNAYQCYRLNHAISDEIGALVEPFSAAVRAVAQGQPQADDQVLIMGAGPIGLMCLMAARIFGVKRVTVLEMSERRISAARVCGATQVIHAGREDALQQALEITGGAGFDLVLECVGQASSVLMAGRLVRTRGHLVVLGVFEKPAAIDLTDLVFREKIISGSMSGYGFYDQTITMMSDPRFRGDVLITDRIGLGDLVGKGYRALLDEKDRHIKIIVHPN